MGPICDGSATEEDACVNLCDCMYFFPTDVEACTSQCVTEFAPQATQECLDCVAGAECIDLESGRTCQDECATDGLSLPIGEDL